MTSNNFPIQDWMVHYNTLAIVMLSLGMAVVFLYRKKIRQSLLEWRTRHCLDKIGITQLRGVIYIDERDEKFVFERLVMLPKAILLIHFKPYSGNIFCAEHILHWTQVIAQKSYQFQNPLFELDNQVASLRNQFPDILIHGLLFFDHNARFPKGHPDRLIHPQKIPAEYSRANCAEPDQAILDSWQILLRLDREKPALNRSSRLKT